MTQEVTPVLIYLLLAVGSFPLLCTGFSPDFAFTFAIFSTDSMDHQEITEAGALTVLKDYLLDNPNTEVDSTAVINSLQNPSARSLFGAYYHGTPNCTQTQCDLLYRYYTRALESIQAANTDVDSVETGIPLAHFDNEAIPEGNNRLQIKRQIIISNILERLYEKARLETGLALHTLQDFYSHSNWVELDNTEPLEDLGRPAYTPNNIASHSTPTCTDCERGQNVSDQQLNFIPGLAQFKHEYDCVDNIRSDIISNNVLTTGYTGRAPNGEKPDGKCSHAGVIDYTATLKPVGGINKDIRSNVWSPHFDLHDEAARVAVKATALFLQDIREAVGNEAFGTFLNIKQPRSSIAFVLDTTGSTGYYTHLQAALPRIQEGIERYQESTEGVLVLDYVLETLGTPDQRTVNVTDNFTVLRESIEELSTTGGGAEDCMESSIGAIIRAADYSKVGGVINIFTDGQPNDIQRLPEALAIINTKNIKVNIFFILGCIAGRRRRRQATNQVYEHLAFISGGHILDVPAEDIADIDSIVLSSIRSSTATLFRQQAGSDFSGALQFQVDSTITTALITVNGNNLQIEGVLSPQGEDVSGQTILQVHLSSSSSYLVTITMPPNDTYYGTWSLSFNSSSYHRVLITGDSSLTFSYTLYRGSGEIKEKAQPGEPLLPSVRVDREVERAVITAGSIINSAGVTLPLPVSLTSDELTGNYVAITGTPPIPFALRVVGTDSRGFPYNRIIGGGVDVSDTRIRLSTGQSPFQVLRSGDEKTLSLVLSNQGGNATFTVQALTSGTSSGFAFSFEGNTVSQTVNLASGGTAILNLQITAQENIDETNSLSLIIAVYDQDSVFTQNNYFNIEVVGTTVPPVDLSQIEFYNADKKLGGAALHYMALISAILIGVNLH